MSGMELAAAAIESGRIHAALVVAAESSRHVVTRTIDRLNAEATAMDDFKEALPTLTLGSGAVAAVLVHERLAQSGHRLGHSVTLADNTASTICLGTPDWMKTDAQRLLHSGVALGKRTWAAAAEQLGFHVDTVDQYICHQVGATHMATLFGALALPLERAFLTYPQFGNIGPAAVPLTLRLCADAGRLKAGDKLALMGIGSGLNCMMMEMTW